MKTHIRLLAFAAALPLTVMAQSSSSGSSTGSSTSGSNSSTSSSSNYPSSSSASRDSSATQRAGNSASSSYSSPSSSGSLSSDSSSSGMGATAGIQRLSQQQVDQQLTAKALIGKNVYDNAGKRVGEVKDIVLDSSGVPQLASVASGHDKNSNSNSSSANSTRSSGMNDSSRTNSSNSGLGSAATDLANSAMGMASSMMSSPAAIISSGGFMGMGDNLLRVPLNQLSYDSSSDHLTLNVSQAELSSLTNDKSTRSAAE